MDNFNLTECFLQTRDTMRFTKQGFEENESLDDLAYAFTGDENKKTKPQIILDDGDIVDHTVLNESVTPRKTIASTIFKEEIYKN